jgi:small subunit ribosomal protein S16
MLKIKLAPRGKKHQITYRIVVAECRSKFDGKFTDDLGFYTPQTKTIQLDKEKLAQWQKNGAQITKGVDKLINPDKYPNKKKVSKKKETAPTEAPKQEAPVKETPTQEAPKQEAPVKEAPAQPQEEVKEEK